VWESQLGNDVLVFHSALRRWVFLAPPLVAALLIGAASFASCGGHVGKPDSSVDAGIPERVDEPYFPEASCFVRIDSPPLLPGIHVPIGTDITTWNSNPPSSGEHYPIWAAYQEFDAAVPRGFYVHDLEHGAVDYLYNCALLDAGAVGDAGDPCAAVVAALEQAVAAMATDPLCDPSVRVRHVITPDPLIAYPVAAATWGWTYNAACVDLPTLEAFAKVHYAQSPEDFCSNGITNFEF
jgi:hypothetical protein